MSVKAYILRDNRKGRRGWKVQIRNGADTIDAGSFENEHVARIAAAKAEAELLQRLRRETPIDQFLLRAAPCRPWRHDPMRRTHYVTANR